MLRHKRFCFTITITLILLIANCFNCASAQALAIDNSFETELKMPIYQWNSVETQPKAIVIAVHGLIMHASRYDGMASNLAREGFTVFAQDLRGYGKLSNTCNHEYCTDEDCRQIINYEKSFLDLVKMTKAIKEKYPSLPVFIVGESLGGDFAIRLAGTYPNLVQGIILSAPAIQRHSFVDMHMIANLGIMITCPRTQISLYHFVKSYTSDDPRIINELLNDPLVRHSLSSSDLLKSTFTIRRTKKYIAKVSPETPVLVIQGSADRCVKTNGVVVLLENLRSVDQTVRWFPQRGHIILETAYISTDAMQTVSEWLNEHTGQIPLQAKAYTRYWQSKSLNDIDTNLLNAQKIN
jgi:alpha-beta hydrolase superfamily lysophospholipase